MSPRPELAPWEGVLVPELSNSRETVFLLARGAAETTVYRVVPRSADEPSYELKRYGNAEKFQTERDGYEVLKRSVTGAPGSHFDLPKVEVVGADRLKLDDVRGRALNTMLNDDRVPPELKLRLRQSYAEKLMNLKAAIKVAYPECRMQSFFEVGEATLAVSLLLDSGERLPLSIRSSQVVVVFEPGSEIFRLVLIDPY